MFVSIPACCIIPYHFLWYRMFYFIFILIDRKTTKDRPPCFSSEDKTYNTTESPQPKCFANEVCPVKQISQLLNCYEVWSTSTTIDSPFPDKLVYLLELFSTVLISSEGLTPSFSLLSWKFSSTSLLVPNYAEILFTKSKNAIKFTTSSSVVQQSRRSLI